MLVQITLAIAAGAALINVWLGVRIGAVRAREKIGHGDGGNPLLGRRMRAQLNFVENAPFVLILMLAIELSSGSGAVLLLVGLLFLIGRVLHGIGMDAEVGGWPRTAGTLITLVTLVVLAVWAIVLGYASLGSGIVPAVA